MLNYNHIPLIPLLLSSTLLHAGTMGAECTPGNVTIPCHEQGFTFGALALYLQPSFGNGLGYSTYNNYGFDVNGVEILQDGAPDKISNVFPNWGWGFQIEGKYQYRSGNDIDVNWYHMNQSTTGYLPVGTLFSGSAPGLYAGKLTVSPQWNAVNIELGQQLQFDTNKLLRIHGGLQLAQVQTQFTNYPRLSATSDPLFVTKDKITYQGIGPRIGADFGYGVFFEGFKIDANAAAALLVGTSKQNVSGYTNYTPSNPNYATQFFSTGNYVQSNPYVVVPEIEAKLGAEYAYPTTHGLWNLNIGYLWINYLNGLISQVGMGVEGSAISQSSAVNFTLNGLYFGLKWKSND